LGKGPLIGGGIGERIMARFGLQPAPDLMHNGFSMIEKAMVQTTPFPVVHLVFSDGLNPVSFFVGRFPKGMPLKDVQRRVEERLKSGPGALGSPSAVRLRSNWLIVATGEVDPQLLELALDKAELRLDELLPPGGGADGPGRGEGGGEGGPPDRPGGRRGG
jgi:hypothetical protein